jgi:hypothetical protein
MLTRDELQPNIWHQCVRDLSNSVVGRGNPITLPHDELVRIGIRPPRTSSLVNCIYSMRGARVRICSLKIGPGGVKICFLAADGLTLPVEPVPQSAAFKMVVQAGGLRRMMQQAATSLDTTEAAMQPTIMRADLSVAGTCWECCWASDKNRHKG